VGARFSNRGLMIGAPVSVALIIATTVGVDAGYVASHPEALAVPLLLVLCVAVYMSPLVASDVRHRADSTLDQLTGLLNRRGLEPRFAEVAEQAALTQQPVSVVVADIDHFKRINDTHGHPVGDAVLREVADEMRRSLRTFELLYRFGGEEFLLLLPGADAENAARIAETLRDAVEQLHPAGLPVECSFGSATGQGEDVIFAKLVEAADVALYDAKRFGRNRVEQSADGVLVPTPT
jgi:diguanylate cyclase (GGDEF)-like protein